MNLGASRETVQIGRKPAANIHHATRAAARINLPLNRFVTINYSHTACPAHDASSQFRKLLASWFARWLRRHLKNTKRSPPTYVWVFEAAGGQLAVHWLVHIPRGLVREFESVLPVWLTATVGDFDSSAVLHRPIYNITGAKRYLLKGMDPHFARLWQINPVDQGKVIGKRSGFSRNLGPAARSRVGYRVQRRYAGGWS